ncbi:mutagen-sensitive 302 isoform X2 [Lycorma delicatula]
MDSDSDPRDWEDYEDFDDFLVDEVSGMMSAGSDISSISTDIDIILADDDMSVDTYSERSDDEDRPVDDIERNGEHHNYALRSRSRTGGNIAPIPPSRISDLNSDTEMESINDDNEGNSETSGNEGDDDGELQEEEEEVEVEQQRNSIDVVVSVQSDDIIIPLPVYDEVNIIQPQEQQEEQQNVIVQENDNQEQIIESSALAENVVPNSRRLPLSEIASVQQVPEHQKTIRKLQDKELTPKAKKNRISSDDADEGDDGMTCSVCLDVFTNSGPHRLVSLRCGHLFGNSCVERWLKSGCMGGARRCPTCNKKASIKDIRVIYARRLQAIDTSEKDRIQMELDKVKEEKSRLEIDLTRVKLNCDMQQKLIDSLKERISFLENSKASLDNNLSQKNVDSKLGPVSFIQSIELSKCSGCRVLNYSSSIGLIVVSQKSANTLFPGYGIRKIDSIDLRPTTFINLHSNVIRDLAFHPQDRNLLLSASLDRTAKIFDNVSNSVVQIFNCENLLWSCAWDVNNPHQLLTGSQNGIVTVYDKRHTTDPISTYITNGDTTPVVSLVTIPPTRDSVLSVGGILSCRLNAVYAYCGISTTSQLVMIDGPFISLSYDSTSQLILASTRPSSRFPVARHMLNQFAAPGDSSFCNNVQVFTCGNSGQLMSRSCQLNMPDGDVWVGAYDESERAVQLLSMSYGGAINKITVSEPVVDLCPLEMNHSCLLGSLSGNTLNVHKIY